MRQPVDIYLRPSLYDRGIRRDRDLLIAQALKETHAISHACGQGRLIARTDDELIEAAEQELMFFAQRPRPRIKRPVGRWLHCHAQADPPCAMAMIKLVQFNGRWLALVSHTAVHPALREQGLAQPVVGAPLLHTLLMMSHLYERGPLTVVAVVSPSNTAAIRALQRIFAVEVNVNSAQGWDVNLIDHLQRYTTYGPDRGLAESGARFFALGKSSLRMLAGVMLEATSDVGFRLPGYAEQAVKLAPGVWGIEALRQLSRWQSGVDDLPVVSTSFDAIPRSA